jgi:hypothetical protein
VTRAKRSLARPRLAVLATCCAVGAAAAASLWLRPPRDLPLSETACGKGAVALIGSLREPVFVTLYSSSATPRGEAALSFRLRELEKASAKRLVVEVIRVDGERTLAEAKDVGISEGDLGGGALGYRGVAIRSGVDKEVIPFLDPQKDQGALFAILDKVHELARRAEEPARFAVVRGKGGISIAEQSLAVQEPHALRFDIQHIFETAMPQYRLEQLDLRGGESEINAAYTALLLLQPESDYTEAELRRIDEFLMRGRKTVIALVSAISAKAADATMAGTIGAHGLDRLLGEYGVELGADVVEDPAQQALFSVAEANATGQLRLPGVVVAKHAPTGASEAQPLDTSFLPFFQLDEVAFAFASTLALHPERQPSARLRAVARSSERAVSVRGDSYSLLPTEKPPPPGEMRRRVLAAALDGRIKSAYSDSTAEGRLLVISASQLAVNPLARAANPIRVGPLAEANVTSAPDATLTPLSKAYAWKYLTTSIAVLRNTLDWASTDDGLLSCGELQ